MRTSYGFILIHEDIEKLDKSRLESLIGFYKDPEVLLKAVIEGYRFRQHKEPDIRTKQMLEKALKMNLQNLTGPLQMTSIRDFTQITHCQISIDNAERLARKLSFSIENKVISIAGFDETVFQLCIYENGTRLTRHQIGDAIEEFGLQFKLGDVKTIGENLNISFETAERFVYETDLFRIEKYLKDFCNKEQ